jgi:hypothetical protein
MKALRFEGKKGRRGENDLESEVMPVPKFAVEGIILIRFTFFISRNPLPVLPPAP